MLDLSAGPDLTRWGDLRDGALEAAVRTGIHTGPAVAGVIGRRKFIYDIWGDTVNTASRMESHGEVGETQLSAVTADRLDGRFETEERGLVELKGKGPMRTFWLRGCSA